MRLHRDIAPRRRLETTLSTGGIVLAIVGFAALVGYLTLGLSGVIAALVFSALFAGAGGLPSSLVMRWQGALRLPQWQAPGLHRMVEHLAWRAGIEKPALYLVPSPEPNAMATGHADRDGAVAITKGLLHALERDELEGVLAHEIAHLRNNDTVLRQLAGTVGQAVTTVLQVAIWMTLLVAFFGGATSLARLLLLTVLALVVPSAMNLLVAALSRARELAADATAAELTGAPRALAAALARLERRQRSWIHVLLGRSPAPPALRSHPPTAERVQRLLALEGRGRRGDGDVVWSQPSWARTGFRS
jgi:heat shock protein HtpX